MGEPIYFEKLFITITAETHGNCLLPYTRVRHLCKAFSASIKETKNSSNRIVLNRVLQVSIASRAETVIAFKESLRCIIDTLREGPCNIRVRDKADSSCGYSPNII